MGDGLPTSHGVPGSHFHFHHEGHEVHEGMRSGNVSHNPSFVSVRALRGEILSTHANDQDEAQGAGPPWSDSCRFDPRVDFLMDSIYSAFSCASLADNVGRVPERQPHQQTSHSGAQSFAWTPRSQGRK